MVLVDEIFDLGKQEATLEQEQLRIDNEIRALEQQRSRIGDEIDKIRERYRQLVRESGNGKSASTSDTGNNEQQESTLRQRILTFLPEKAVHIDTIQEGLQIRDGRGRDRMMWTLNNLKKAELVENPRRGYWQKKKLSH